MAAEATASRTRPGTSPNSRDVLERQPPFDKEAEQGVLGSIMLLPEVLDEVSLVVQASDFYDDAHRKLYQAMLDCYERWPRFDLTLLIDKLRQAGNYESVGGGAYLGRIVNSVANAAHAVYYAEIVRAKALARGYIHSATDLLKLAYDESTPTAELQTFAESQVLAVGERMAASNRRAGSWRDIVIDTLGKLDDDKKVGLRTGFTALDSVTGGLHAGELIVLAARPSMGKSAFALNIAVNASRTAPVFVASVEMSGEELATRLLVQTAKVDSWRVRNGDLTVDNRRALVAAAAQVGELRLHVDDADSQSVASIGAQCRRLKRKGGLGLVVIDYLQLVEPESYREPRQEQVARMTRGLKKMAKSLGVPVIVLAQLNRQMETKGGDNIPRMSHLRESGAIEQDADVVLFVHRPGYYTNEYVKPGEFTKAQIIVAKQRNGPVGAAEVLWFPAYSTFADPKTAFDPEFKQQPLPQEEVF